MSEVHENFSFRGMKQCRQKYKIVKMQILQKIHKVSFFSWLELCKRVSLMSLFAVPTTVYINLVENITRVTRYFLERHPPYCSLSVVDWSSGSQYPLRTRTTWRRRVQVPVRTLSASPRVLRNSLGLFSCLLIMQGKRLRRLTKASANETS